MRTVFVTTSYPSNDGDPSGHFVRAEALEACAREHARITVLAPTSFEGETPENVVSVPHGPFGGAFGWPGAAARIRENPLRALGVWPFCRNVRQELARRAPTHVIAHWALPSGIACLAGSWNLELVSHGADVRLLSRLPPLLRNELAHTFARRSSGWRFVSHDLLETFLESLEPRTRGEVRAKSVVLPSPLRFSTPTEVRPKAPNETRLVWVGRLVPSKSFERALVHVSCTQKDAHLVVVGDGPLRARYEHRAVDLGVRASFVGKVPRPEALGWIASADALLMSSRIEGLSTVVREAEALGTRVLWI